jgi:TetR/AcrR family transcriptional repressor of nem operon
MPMPNLKQAIIDAGATEFHLQGYSATGVAAIAARAGAPKGSFYNHFASKEELAIDVLARYGQARRMEMLEESPVAPLDRIRAHFEHLRADLAKDDYRRGCMFGNFAAEAASTNANLKQVLDTAFGYWGSLLTAALEQARANGSISTTLDPVVTAQFLIDAWEGAAIRAKAVGNAGPIDNFMDFAFARLLVP